MPNYTWIKVELQEKFCCGGVIYQRQRDLGYYLNMRVGRREACPNNELCSGNGCLLKSASHYLCLLVSSGLRVLSGFMDIWKI